MDRLVGVMHEGQDLSVTNGVSMLKGRVEGSPAVTLYDLVPLLGVVIEGLVGSNKQPEDIRRQARIHFCCNSEMMGKGNRELKLLCSVYVMRVSLFRARTRPVFWAAMLSSSFILEDRLKSHCNHGLCRQHKLVVSYGKIINKTHQ